MGTKVDVSNFQMDYSSLLGSTSSGSGGFGSGSFYSDYASIKNGSYGKLLGSYYDKQKAEATSSSDGSKVTYSSYKPSPVGFTDSSETLGKMGTALNALKNSTYKLNGSGGSVFNKVETTTTDANGLETTTSAYDTDGIYKAVSSFVNDYNNLLNANSGSVSTGIIERTNALNAMTQDNKEMLAKVGVSVGADGRLTVDEKALKAADIEDVKETFNGVGSFADQATSKLFLLDLAVTREGKNAGISSSYQNNQTSASQSSSSTSTSTSNDTSKLLAKIEEDAENLKRMMDSMLKYGSDSIFNKNVITTTDENGVDSSTYDYDKDKIYDSVSSFVNSYNEMMESGADSNSSNILNKISSLYTTTKSVKDDLAAVGITIGNDGQLSIDEEKFKGADMEKVKNLFNGTGSYGYQVSSQAAGIDSAAASEAIKANTYSESGNYTNNYATGSIFDDYL